ncbi:hypothetical protein BaRGS_00032839, partial [Batillaria attramentaria]
MNIDNRREKNPDYSLVESVSYLGRLYYSVQSLNHVSTSVKGEWCEQRLVRLSLIMVQRKNFKIEKDKR